jgi:hypothetical protein
MTIDKDEQWEANNYIKLSGEAVKNRGFPERITHKLRTINVQFRKVKGHNHYQWNDAADALAVMGRDEAINWPKCSFDMMVAGGQIPFRTRAMMETTTLLDLCLTLGGETDQRLPSYRDLKVFKDGNPCAGMWTTGHYQLIHKSLPAPVVAQAGPAAIKARPAVFGIYDGKKFRPTRPIDISTVTEDERLTVFSSVFPIGREVRYFVGNTEDDPVLLKPGQPYSVYPKRFARSNESKARIKDTAPPVRTEGPFVNVQWTLFNGQGQLLIMTSTALVPEEITPLQFWKKFGATRYTLPVRKVAWGKHCRGGLEIESGKVTTLEEADSVEIIVDEKKKKSQQCEVTYTVGDETQVYKSMVRKESTIGQIREIVAMAHKGRPIAASF